MEGMIPVQSKQPDHGGRISDDKARQLKKNSKGSSPEPPTPGPSTDQGRRSSKKSNHEENQTDNAPKPSAPAPSAGLKGNIKTYLMFPWDKKWITFVTVIWSVEVWKTCMDILLVRHMRHELPLDPNKIKMTEYWLSSCVGIVFGMFGMGITVNYLLDRKVKIPFYGVPNLSKNFKYFILLIGLFIHLGWSAVSVVTILCHHTVVGLKLLWMGFAWYLVHPIRYLLIFHQKMPIVFLHSHMLVTFNVGLIQLANYICNVFLACARNITESGFSITWALLLVLGIAWILGIYFVKRYRNPVSEDLQSVRRFYEHTEAISSFDSKQTPSRQLIFLALLVPGVVLAFTHATVTAVLRQMALDAGNSIIVGFHDFRADLIIAFVTMASVEAIVIYFRRYRKDVFELIVIGLAHVLYIIVLVLIAVIIKDVQDILKETPRRGHALVEIYLSEANSNTAGYVFRDTSVEYGAPNMAKFLKRQIPMNGSEESLALKIFNKPFGDRVSLSNVTLESGKFQLFQMVQTSNLVKITKPNKVLPIYTFDPQVYVLNSISECHTHDKELANILGINLTNARGVLFTGGVCAPVEVSFHVMRSFFEDLDYTELGPDIIKDVIRVKPPGFEGISPYYTIPCQYPPLPNNSYTCVTVFQGYYKMFEYYRGIGKPFPSPERQAFRLVSLKPYSINPRRLDYLTKPHQLINTLNTISFRNVVELGLERMGVPILLHGIATGIGTVSYIHLIWRQVSIPNRALVVYGYFALTFLVTSVVPLLEARRLLMSLPVLHILLYVQAAFGAFWHIVCALKLYRKMSESVEKSVSVSSRPPDLESASQDQ